MVRSCAGELQENDDVECRVGQHERPNAPEPAEKNSEHQANCKGIDNADRSLISVIKSKEERAENQCSRGGAEELL